MTRRRTRITGRYDCGDGEHQVVSATGDGEHWNHRREPCAQCPWRSDLPTGVFPAAAFRHSAITAYDGAVSTFACHMSGADKPATCAGFLLRNAEHNVGVRIAAACGLLGPVSDAGLPLYDNYRVMAIANGVDPDDPVLKPCRANDE